MREQICLPEFASTGEALLAGTPVERLRLVPENIARLIERLRRKDQERVDVHHFAAGLRITIDPNHVAPVGSPRACAPPSKHFIPGATCGHDLTAVPIRIEKGEFLF